MSHLPQTLDLHGHVPCGVNHTPFAFIPSPIMVMDVIRFDSILVNYYKFNRKHLSTRKRCNSVHEHVKLPQINVSMLSTKNRAYIKSITIRWRNQNNDLLQGSVLSPWFFNIYTDVYHPTMNRVTSMYHSPEETTVEESRSELAHYILQNKQTSSEACQDKRYCISSIEQRGQTIAENQLTRRTMAEET